MKKTILFLILSAIVGSMNATNQLTIESFSINAGETKAVSMNMTMENVTYRAIQFDLVLPEGVTVALKKNGKADFSLSSERFDPDDGYTVNSSQLSDGSYRVIIASLSDGAVIYEEEGVLLTVKLTASETAVSGEYQGSIKNQMLAIDSNNDDSPADTNFGCTIIGNAVQKEDLTSLSVSLTGWAYGADPNSPVVTGNSGNGTVTYKYKEKNAADDTYSDDVPTAVGTYTVQATIAETDNYNGKVVTADFAISKADITPTVTLEGWTVGAAANTPNVEGNSGNGTVTYKYKEKDAADDTYSDDVPTAVGTYTVQATVAETDNYNSVVATTDFEITAPAVTTYTVTWQNYDGTTLETDENVESGAMPSYDSETPVRAADGKKTYSFAGWTPFIAEVTDNAIYTATYDETDETIDGITVTTAAEGDVALEINDAEAEAVKGLIPADVDEVTVTYTRELTLSGTEAEMYTVCLPYNPPTGDNLTYYTLSTVSGTTLTFDEVTTPEAYKPYLVVASANGSVGTTTAQSVDLSTDITGTQATGGEYELCGTLRGMTNAEAAGGDIYILQDDGTWHKVTTEYTDAYIPPFRAYIVKQGGGGNARLRSTLGGTTRIGDRVSEGTADDWYDLQGRKMTGFDKQKSLHRLPKGVYVRKEQKIIIP